MARTQRLGLPPSTGNKNLDRYLLQISDALNQIPAFSIVSISGTPNDSGVTADAGTFLINVAAASDTSRYWINQSGVTSNWSLIHYG